MSKERNLSREVVAVQIPSGDKVILPSGAKIFITQTLGGSFTVMTDTGLARIEGKDADALTFQAYRTITADRGRAGRGIVSAGAATGRKV